jgi:translation initiation factor 2 subunit 1
MVKKENEFPDFGENVIGTVTKVNPFSVQVMMDEYHIEGMVHVSEVARKWVRDIREHAKVGQKVVAKVIKIDQETGYIALSFKRVSDHEASERLKEFKRENKAEKMLNVMAKEKKVSLDDMYKEIGFQLQEVFGEMFKAFQLSLTPQGCELLEKKGISQKWISAIKAVAEKQMEVKEAQIKAIMSLSCYKPGGVDIIKKVLADAEAKHKVEIKYISAPKYSVALMTKNAKLGEKEISEISKDIIKKIESAGGEGSYEIAD